MTEERDLEVGGEAQAAPAETAQRVAMSPEGLSQLERDIQLGRVKTLPDGRAVDDVRKELRERHLEEGKASSDGQRKAFIEQSSAKPPETVQVSTTDTGQLVASASSDVAGTIEEAEGEGQGAQLSSRTIDGERLPAASTDPLPLGFPSRGDLIAAGFDTLSKVRAATDEQLEALPHIGRARVAEIRRALG